MFAMRPELDRVRTHAKAGPGRRSRHFPASELPCEAREPSEQLSARAKPGALMRRTRGKLALARPGCPIRVGLLRCDFLYAPLHADLPALRMPVVSKRRARIVPQLTP